MTSAGVAVYYRRRKVAAGMRSAQAPLPFSRNAEPNQNHVKGSMLYRPCRYLLFVVLLLAVATILAAPSASAQLPSLQIPTGAPRESAPAQPATPLTLEEQLERLTERRDSVQQELTRLQSVQDMMGIMQLGAFPEEHRRRIELYRDLIQIFERHMDTLRRIASLEESLADIEEEANEWQGFAADAEITVLFVDGLRDRVRAKQLELAALDVEESLVTTSADAFRRRWGPVTPTHSELETSPFGATPEARRAWVQQGDALRQRLETASVALEDVQKRALEIARRQVQAELAFLERQLEAAAPRATFAAAELEGILATIDEALVGLGKEMDDAIAREARARQDLDDARTALAVARGRSAADEEEQQRNAAETARLQQAVEMRRSIQQALSGVVEGIRILSVVREVERAMWEERFELGRDPSVGTERLNELAVDLRAQIESLEGWRTYFESNLSLVRSRILSQEERLAAWTPEFGDVAIGQELLTALREREAVLLRGSNLIDSVGMLMNRRLAEVDALRSRIPLSERIAAGIRAGWSKVSGIWNYQIFTVTEDTVVIDGQEVKRTRGITVRKVVLALFLLTLGLLFSRRAARFLRALFGTQFHFDDAVSALVEKGAYYVLFITVVFGALAIVEIPLTVFAFFGGALAIGVGFGAQNLINNFISGLILLFERPIKVGDIVEVDGVGGKITNVGGRCSLLHRFDGVDMLVPNSSFLEKSVTNWTHSDRQVRYKIKVGVAYGTPLRDAQRLLMRAVSEHGQVMKDPEPVVVLDDFAADALSFTLYYWIEVGRNVDARIVGSDIRFRIDKLFREAGIVIAYPQRDVHIDTMGPMKVQLVESDGAEEESEPPDTKPRLP